MMSLTDQLWEIAKDEKSMMTDATMTIKELRDKVAAGTADSGCFWRALSPYGNNLAIQHAVEAYEFDDLNEARSLHEALLPEWSWCVEDNGFASVYIGDFMRPATCRTYHADAETSARAWLLAVLDALTAQETK